MESEMKFSTMVLGAALLALPTGANATGVNLITNGDFSSGDFSGWTLFTQPSYGTLGTRPLPEVTSFDVTGSGASTAAHFEVGQAPYTAYGVQAGGGLRQSFTTTEAGTLSFSADIAATGTPYGQNGAGGLFTVSLNGIAVASYDFGAIAQNATERSTLNFTALVGIGLQNLEILVTRPYTAFYVGQYIDNISAIEQTTGATATPLPAALPLCATGLAGLGLLGWRRRSKANAAA
jgi:hypothetical protein